MITDNRPCIYLGVDCWRAAKEIVELLADIPGMFRIDDELFMREHGLTYRVSAAKLRHYVSMVCILVNDKGKDVHPTGMLISSVRLQVENSNIRMLSEFNHIDEFMNSKKPKEELIETNAEKETKFDNRIAIIDGWAELPGSGEGLSVPQVIDMLVENPDSYETLRKALQRIGRVQKNGLPYSATIGRSLALASQAINIGTCLKKIAEKNKETKWAIFQQ